MARLLRCRFGSLTPYDTFPGLRFTDATDSIPHWPCRTPGCLPVPVSWINVDRYAVLTGIRPMTVDVIGQLRRTRLTTTVNVRALRRFRVGSGYHGLTVVTRMPRLV